MLKRKSFIFTGVFTLSLLVLFFQNCGEFSSESYQVISQSSSAINDRENSIGSSDSNLSTTPEIPIDNEVPIVPGPVDNTDDPPSIENPTENEPPKNPPPDIVKNSLLRIPTVPLKAFPSAEGFGAAAVGGRGGNVIFVTNTNDSGNGSLRQALAANGPRIIIFQVSGTITVSSALKIINPFVTIAGQTAPGDGVTIRRKPEYNGPVFSVEASDVIIRNLRFRPGLSNAYGCCGDAFSISGQNKPVSRVIIDHSSFSWSEDENFDSWYNVTNVTIQWSFFSEGLAVLPYISGKPYGKGALLGGDGGNVSLHHNLFAHNIERTAMFAASSGTMEFVNNYIYNWRSAGLEISGQKGGFGINVIGNIFEAGADTSASRFSAAVFNNFPEKPLIYLGQNLSQKRANLNQEKWDFIGDGRASAGVNYLIIKAPKSMQRLEPNKVSSYPVSQTELADVKKRVLENSGATHPQRDAVDHRVLESVKNKTGTIISNPAEVGSWPSLKSNPPPLDSDRDGIPDSWEEIHGMNKLDASDAKTDFDNDGYLNLEEYLNELAGDVPK